MHDGQGGFAGIGRLVVVHHRQRHRELIFRHSHHAALVAVHNRDGFAPVALAAEHPVAELVVDLLLAQPFLLQILNDRFLRLRDLHAIKEAGIDHHAVLNIGIRCFLNITARDDLNHRDAELMRELPVAGIMRRNSHDCARAVGHQNVVAQPNRNFLTGHGVDGADTLQLHAGLILRQLGALKVTLLRGLRTVRHARVVVGDLVLQLVNQRMLRGQDHVRRTEERIRARGENAHLLARHGQGKIHFRADTAANPVALLHLHLVDEVHRVQAVEQLLGIGGNLQHPLLLDLADDLRAAALAHAADNFLIRQTALAAGAPVNRHFGLVRQPVLEQLKENPLRPAVVGRIGGVDLAGIVEGEADFLQLLTEVVDVLLRHNGGVNLVLDGVVLRRQTEGVPADGEKDIAALHAALAGDDVHRGIGARMPDVQPLSRRIRELNQAVEFRHGVVVLRLENVTVRPALLPLRFDGFGVIGFEFHDASSLLFSDGTKKRSAPANSAKTKRMFRGTTLLVRTCRTSLARNVRHSPNPSSGLRSGASG